MVVRIENKERVNYTLRKEVRQVIKDAAKFYKINEGQVVEKWAFRYHAEEKNFLEAEKREEAKIMNQALRNIRKIEQREDALQRIEDEKLCKIQRKGSLGVEVND